MMPLYLLCSQFNCSHLFPLEIEKREEKGEDRGGRGGEPEQEVKEEGERGGKRSSTLFHIRVSGLVCSGYSAKYQTGGLRDNRNLFLTVLKSGSLRS